ncbi:hypothetical protein VTO42DRAFT_2768 [Malbranchea cinnamomea]
MSSDSPSVPTGETQAQTLTSQTETQPPMSPTPSESHPPPATTPTSQLPPESSTSLTEPSSTPSPTSTPTSITSSSTTHETTSSSVTSSEIIESTSSTSSSQSVTTITVTSTAPFPTTSDTLPSVSTDLPTITSSALPASPSEAGGGGGLSAGGTIAVAVVVPVVSVALIIVALIFFWRKRKAEKLAEEERKQEIEEYQFNPNNDPTFPNVGLAGNYDDGPGAHSGNAGYRGWGTTTTSRKLSTNLSSGPGMTVSDGDTAYGRSSPVDHNAMRHPDEGYRPVSGEIVGDLHAVPVSNSNRGDIRRGPSNASSAYSVGNRSDISDDLVPGPPLDSQYYEDSPYYGGTQQGPYGDMAYGGPQPVIRDVQARRNTRIETPSVFPQQGNAGISQNF